MSIKFKKLNNTIIKCKKCPRLLNFIKKISLEKRKQNINEKYWGKPVTGFGDVNAKLMIIGLAPAPDFPKILIWDKMTGDEKRKLVKNRKISIKYEDGSKNDFSYKLIKDSFKNLTLSNSITFNGPVYLYHGMADDAVPYDLSIKIIKNFTGTKDVKLLLERDAGHRLSDIHQLKTITNIIEEIKIKI